jgi:hypothetical protein
MFSDKGFVVGTNVDLYSGSTAAATAVIVTAATVAGKKLLGNSTGQPTAVTKKLWKQDWINGTASEHIA